MSKSNGRFSLDTWRQEALKADRKSWRAAYDHFFKQDLQNAPQWRRWEQTGEITLNERQTVVWEKIKRRSGTFLDVGCGPGFLVGALIGHGKDAYGCDCSQEAIHFAKRSAATIGAADRFFRMDLEDIPSLGKTYDTVTCMEVLEHLVDPEAALRILWDRVAEGGLLFVTMPKRVNDFNQQHLQEFDRHRVKALVDMLCEDGEKKYPAVASQIKTNDGTTNWIISLEKREADLKFVMVSGTTTETQQANDISGDGRIKTGVFNWQRLFRGYATQVQSLTNPHEFDVIHLQLSGTNFDAPRQIRDMLGPKSDTKLVINLDYAPEFWYMYPPYPKLLIDQLKCADYLMGVDPWGAKVVAELTGRPVHVVPHPASVEEIAKLSKPVHERSEALVMLHRDNQDYLPYWMLEGTGLKTRVIGRLTAVGNATGSAIDYPAMIYDYIHEGYLGGEVTVGIMSQSLLAVDCYSHHVCGRSSIELAALGVPCIGHPNVWAQQVCFPELTIPNGDVVAGRALAQRLVSDPDFYKGVAEHAQEKVQMFNYENARQRYLTMIGRMEGDARPMLPAGLEEVRPEAGRSMEPAAGAVADPAPVAVG